MAAAKHGMGESGEFPSCHTPDASDGANARSWANCRSTSRRRMESTLATTLPLLPSAAHPAAPEIVHSSHTLLKYVPIIAGADKATNLIVNWEEYLNPAIPQ